MQGDRTIPPLVLAAHQCHRGGANVTGTSNFIRRTRVCLTLACRNCLSSRSSRIWPGFIGKLVEQALSQVFSNEIKKCRPCTKKWTKRPTRGPIKNPRLESSDTCGGPAFLLRKQLMSHILAIECIAYFLKSTALPKFSFRLIRI